MVATVDHQAVYVWIRLVATRDPGRAAARLGRDVALVMFVGRMTMAMADYVNDSQVENK